MLSHGVARHRIEENGITDTSKRIRTVTQSWLTELDATGSLT